MNEATVTSLFILSIKYQFMHYAKYYKISAFDMHTSETRITDLSKLILWDGLIRQYSYVIFLTYERLSWRV
jgi:hypothetical protein